MKVIRRNAIKSLTATSEDAGHPVAFLLNESPKKPWKADGPSVLEATIDLETTGTTGAIGLVGVSADLITATISDPNALEWENIEWEGIEWPLIADAMEVTYQVTDVDQGVFNAWIDFPQFESSVFIKIVLTKYLLSDITLAAGTLVVGASDSFSNPRNGITETLVDYSIYRELSNGVMYSKERDAVRKFTGTIDVNRETEFYAFMHGIARQFKLRPLMWILVDKMGVKWVLYGRLVSMPVGTHANFKSSSISFEIIEVR